MIQRFLAAGDVIVSMKYEAGEDWATLDDTGNIVEVGGWNSLTHAPVAQA